MEARRQQIRSEIEQLEDLIQAIIEIYIPQINEEIETLHQLDADEFLLELRLARIRALQTFVFFNGHTAVYDISLLMDYLRTL